MLDTLISLDKMLTLSLNGSHSLFFDGVMYLATLTQTWIPFMIVLTGVLIKNNSFKKFLIILGMTALCILLADQVASGFCKPYFQRFRPTNDPILKYMVDVVEGYRGGRYGFFSSHAANTFSVALFISLLVRNRTLTITLFSWSLLNCYTRIYLGVHYFGDVTVGLIWGAIVGTLVYFLCKRLFRNLDNSGSKAYISTQYTPGGYLVDDIRLVILSLVATYFYITVHALTFLIF